MDTLEFLNDAAFRLVRIQEENMVLKPWVLIATLLLQNPDGLDLSSLTAQTDWLRHLALAFGAFLDWPGERSHYLNLRLTTRITSSICLNLWKSGCTALNQSTSKQSLVCGKIETGFRTSNRHHFSMCFIFFLKSALVSFAASRTVPRERRVKIM